ncbi:MAG: hypothetical protein SX243_22515 [Acidobacteriota bacterium]|nr:hypothetical protein [Acidobacteriota bacterium]
MRQTQIVIAPGQPQSYDQVLEALAAWVVDPRNGQRLLELIEATLLARVAPYTRELGQAYRRIYRRPTTRNCNALMRVEARPPTLYNPHRYYTAMRDQLLEGFELLETHPVFSNVGLRRDLLTLKARTLTLFFTPQLTRSRRRSENQRSLLDALDQLVGASELDFTASLYFLRRSLAAKSRDYNPVLLTNLSFLVYRRYEHRRREGHPARRARGNLELLLRRVRRTGSTPRTRTGRNLLQHWADTAEAPEALEAWSAMVAGESRFETRAIARRLR